MHLERYQPWHGRVGREVGLLLEVRLGLRLGRHVAVVGRGWDASNR